MDKHSACFFVSLDEVVARYISRPQISANDYAAHIARMAQHYGAGIILEREEAIVTEDAEVISVETVAAPARSGVPAGTDDK